MSLDEKLHGLSTLIEVKYGDEVIFGSGFFFNELGESKDPGWSPVVKTWLVSNRHIVFPASNGNEISPDVIIFRGRKITGFNQFAWMPFSLKREEVVERARVSADASIDIAVVDVTDLLIQAVKNNKNIMNWGAVAKKNLPENIGLSVEASDDVIVIGYPHTFYDTTNFFPIIKSGIIASRWGLNFRGMPCFLIDAKLFPGSSGSIVLLKPINMAVRNGSLVFNNEKQFAFLGIYSEEPYETIDSTTGETNCVNVGLVWYASAVIEITEKGVPFPVNNPPIAINPLTKHRRLK